jgi:DNA damage-binding protein 1
MASPYLYAVTAQKATGVTHAVVGAFTGSAALNLVLAKTSRLEIHAITASGLTPIYEVGLYGRIASLALVRLPVRGVGESVLSGAGRRRE